MRQLDTAAFLWTKPLRLSLSCTTGREFQLGIFAAGARLLVSRYGNFVTFKGFSTYRVPKRPYYINEMPCPAQRHIGLEISEVTTFHTLTD